MSIRSDFGSSASIAQILHRQTATVHGLDDLRDSGLPLGLRVPFRLGKEDTGLLQQVIEPAVAQGLLSGKG